MLHCIILSMSQETYIETKYRKDLKTASHLLYQKGLTAGYDGNLSLKINNEMILVTPTHSHKGLIEENDFIEMDLNGNIISNGRTMPSCVPTTDLTIHLEAYKKRSDIKALIHAHPPTVVSLTTGGIEINQPVIPGVILTLGEIATVSYLGQDRKIECDLTTQYLDNHDAIVLDRHGAVTVGKDIYDALYKMEFLEYVAKIIYQSHTLGEIKTLDGKEIKQGFRFKDLFKRFFESDSPVFQRILNLANELMLTTLKKTTYSQKLSNEEREQLSKEITASLFGMILGKCTKK